MADKYDFRIYWVWHLYLTCHAILISTKEISGSQLTNVVLPKFKKIEKNLNTFSWSHVQFVILFGHAVNFSGELFFHFFQRQIGLASFLQGNIGGDDI